MPVVFVFAHPCSPLYTVARRLGAFGSFLRKEHEERVSVTEALVAKSARGTGPRLCSDCSAVEKDQKEL